MITKEELDHNLLEIFFKIESFVGKPVKEDLPTIEEITLESLYLIYKILEENQEDLIPYFNDKVLELCENFSHISPKHSDLFFSILEQHTLLFNSLHAVH